MSAETANSRDVQHQAETDGIQLMEGESVLQNRRPSWTLWWKQIALAVLVLLGGLAGDAVIGGVLIAGYVVFSRAESRYIVTDEPTKGKVGVISKSSMEYRLADLRSLATSQSLFEWLVGHGTLEFQAGANNKLVWHGVPEYKAVGNTVREEQRKYD